MQTVSNFKNVCPEFPLSLGLKLKYFSHRDSDELDGKVSGWPIEVYLTHNITPG